MVATYPFLATPAGQKSAYWIAILLLHLFLLLCLQQGQLHSMEDLHPATHFDVRILSGIAEPTALKSSASEPAPVSKIASVSGKKELQQAPRSAMVAEPMSDDTTSQAQTTVITGSTPLDLDALRRGAVSEERKQRRVDPLLVPVQSAADVTLEGKFGRDVQNAQRPNCVNAYQNGARIGNVAVAGLLVAGVIVADTLRDKGCKW